MKHNVYLAIFLFIFLGCKNFNTQRQEKSLNIITSDIDNFWIAYDHLATSTDSVQTFQRYYIDKASPEFKEFIKLRNFTAKEYVQSIKKVPSFWRSIRPLTERIHSRKKELLPFFKKMKRVYPAFKQPDVCFAIGTIRTGGTTDVGLILIGSEIAAADSSVDKSEFDDTNFMKVILGNTGDIIDMVAHETIHTQQPVGTDEDKSLLKRAIVEGSADFIATLLLGRVTMNPATFNYGSKHEESLWRDFQEDIKAGKTFDQTDWLYKYQSTRPADLGYYIGYKICESYYDQSKDKSKAISDIIEMEDAEDFLKKSKYNGKTVATNRIKQGL